MMRTMTRSWAFVLACLVAGPTMAASVDIVWKDDPIPLELTVDEEQRIDFPETLAALDVPDALKENASLLLSPKGILLITVNSELADQRIFATSVTGSVYLVDISASKAVSAKDYRIVDPAVEAAREAGEKRIATPFQSRTSKRSPKTYVELARFAMTHHMGPERLIPEVSEATPLSVEPVDMNRFVRLQRHIDVEPLRQWQIGDVYVTTLLAKNTGTLVHQFDARALRGRFLFAATASLVLEPGAETVWSVISKTPFSVAAGPMRLAVDNKEIRK